VALSLPCFIGIIAVGISEGQSMASGRDMAYGTQRQFENAEQSEKLPPRSKQIFRGEWRTRIICKGYLTMNGVSEVDPVLIRSLSL
jgi:hypothetical protein